MEDFGSMTSCNSGNLEIIMGYLRSVAKDGDAHAVFYGHEPFLTMFHRGIISEGVIIRRQAARGPADDSYRLTKEGRLEGMNVPMYPGIEGTHEPESLLALRVNEQGWILSPLAVGKILHKIDRR